MRKLCGLRPVDVGFDDEEEKKSAAQLEGYAADSPALAAIAWFVGIAAFSTALALALVNYESSLFARAFVDLVSVGATMERDLFHRIRRTHLHYVSASIQ
ncbi:hypothetical protein P8935_24135 [Telmatobacter sp. DSM 110680]|uniref:Uncharacterized protein n=1 Tax=Telmatobacter sp. DSM 110680 TaxID=3036704 RepID=A0AAU7DS94_9BACT